MSGVISWSLQLSVNEGQSDRAKTLMAEMVEATRNEAGARGYEWFVSADGSAVHINERYADSAATMEHLGNFGANFAERFLGCFTPTALHVYGDPSDEVRGVLDGFGAVYMGSLGGFAP